jgi:predicted component of type VI protein secretion system
MQQIKKITLLFLIAACLIATGCSSSKKGQCGCPNKQGMVGYK